VRTVTAPETSDLWWKNAVIYCLDVETFFDSNDDGTGDLTGLVERIDYLAELGVSCIWLMPFYPSPHLDDGYDITDHYGVDPKFGSLGDVAVLIRAAHDRGLRIIVDLVVNHTSNRHPWFKAARRSPKSVFRDYYVWSDEQRPPDRHLVFPGEEDEVWTWDEQAGQYFLHHFYSHQPDVNLKNPAVVEEITKIMGFWLQLGIDGFRVDAVPFLVGPDRLPEELRGDPHQLLRDLRSFVSRRRGDAVLLGEVDRPAKETALYFGDDRSDEMHMLLNFPVSQALFLALARGSAEPLADALNSMPSKPRDSQWATFVRNHDELTLDLLSDGEREEVFQAFGPDPDMQLYERGLRRRVPPMLDGDQRRIRLVYSLLFSLPGAPVLFYGEEIGMGENLEVPGRLSVRTPMQWTSAPTGGFSAAALRRLCRRPPQGPFAPLSVNVSDQRGNDDSLLTWMSEAIHCRRQTPEFGWGEPRVLKADHPCLLAHQCRWNDRTAVAVHNFSDERRTTRLTFDHSLEGEVVVLFGGSRDGVRVHDRAMEFEIDAFGYRWFRLGPSPAPKI
jgi:trehalose synthase